jgi:hypothetical protein
MVLAFDLQSSPSCMIKCYPAGFTPPAGTFVLNIFCFFAGWFLAGLIIEKIYFSFTFLDPDFHWDRLQKSNKRILLNFLFLA